FGSIFCAPATFGVQATAMLVRCSGIFGRTLLWLLASFSSSSGQMRRRSRSFSPIRRFNPILTDSRRSMDGREHEILACRGPAIKRDASWPSFTRHGCIGCGRITGKLKEECQARRYSDRRKSGIDEAKNRKYFVAERK